MNIKEIAYLIVDNDVDGRGPTRIDQAFWDEKLRDEAFKKIPPATQGYFERKEKIVNRVEAAEKALNKLDGLDKLVLQLVNFEKFVKK